MPVLRLEIEVREGLSDARAEATRRRLDAWLGLKPREIRTRKVFLIDAELEAGEHDAILNALCDPVAEVGAIGQLPDPEGADWTAVEVGFGPGVTDTVGATVLRAASDVVGRRLDGHAYSATLYLLSGLSAEQVELAASRALHNKLIERVRIESAPRSAGSLETPRAGTSVEPQVRSVALTSAGDEELVRISTEGMLALGLHEMKAIAAHFRGLGRDPSDAELECLAQTWSEHCKHKIFASPIDYVDPEGTKHTLERGLFRTHIRGATEAVGAAREEAGLDPEGPYLVSVFHDNAGVVRFTQDDHLVYKVETHNSPSALDPYGGAMTGIVGVNRDSFGTGLGADLLTNVWGYCLGPPDYAGDLPPGLMRPLRIREGVHEGVIDGGNHSGIPYSRGFEIFDVRYAGKPLVFCGTVAAMPVETAGRPTHEKRTAVGDKIVMIGGRIGKDGIHGATFSSVELDESAPVQAVQIGDPITQKMMFEMLTEARERGLYSAMTDNGAGGLSSSVGEMAEATGGARIDLARAPLKYPGLEPWEILVSEAQERMTVAVPPDQVDAFMELAERREVEASVLGEFTDSGRFEVSYGEQRVCDLDLEFLHEGVPLPTLQARWAPPEPDAAARERGESARAARARDADAGAKEAVPELLARHGLRSHEQLARHYDHEVKGLSVVKPFVGLRANVPSTATVMRVRHGRHEGVVLGEGIAPHFGDLDTHAMARACVDEGVRRVLCAGARLDRICALDNFCWPDPIKSAKTPDGEHKLAQLVRCCEGLDESCRAYGVPLISGKDSMKNDAFLGGVKISIPPTLLVSVMGQLPDVRKALTLEPRAVGDVVWLVGPTRDELGGSVWSRVHETHESAVPRTDLESSRARYAAFVEARDAGLVRSAHAPGRGGLGVALAHMVLASELSIEVDLAGLELPSLVALASESTGRILFTARPGDEAKIRAALDAHGLLRLGEVAAPEAGARLVVKRGGSEVVAHDLADLTRAFEGGPA